MATKYRTFNPPLSEDEIAQIENKTSFGLTREQAEQVIQEQRDWNDHKDNPSNKGKAEEAPAADDKAKGKKTEPAKKAEPAKEAK